MEKVLEYRVPYADVDQMSVVYYANYLIYFEQGRNEFLRKKGFTYFEMEKIGVMLPVIEAKCQYFKPAKYDDLLHIKSELSEVNGVRLKMSCEICSEDGNVLASGYTWHVIVDKDTGKPCRPPEHLKQFLNSITTPK